MQDYQILVKRLKLALDQGIHTLFEYIQHEEIRNSVKTVLEQTRHALVEFEKMLNDKDNPIIARFIPQQPNNLEQGFKTEFAKIDLTKVEKFEQQLIDTIRETIEAVFKLPLKLSLADLQQEAKGILFNSTLEQLGKVLKQQAIQGPSCFISYAWGDSAKTRLVHQIAQQLFTAGINVVLDIWHNRTNSIIQFTGRVYKVDFVLVMGSQLLKQKYDTPGKYGSYVQQELDHIGIRIKERQDKQNYLSGSGVIKVLVENPHWNAFPDFLKPYPFDETDFTNERYYYDKFFNLLSLLYANQPAALNYLDAVKAEFRQASDNVEKLTEEELRQRIIHELTHEQQVAIIDSIKNKLEKAFTASSTQFFSSPQVHHAPDQTQESSLRLAKK